MPRFETRLLRISWTFPIVLLAFGLGTALIPTFPSWARVAGVAMVALGSLVAVLRYASRITIRGSTLEVRFFSPRTWWVDLNHLSSVTARPSKASLGTAPALELRTRDQPMRGGEHATIRLGWWLREPDLLGLLRAAARQSGATLDEQVTQLFEQRPPAEWWNPEQRAARERAKRPPSRIDRVLQRLPRGARLPAQIAAAVALIIGIGLVMQGAALLGENVLFPRQVDPAWATQLDLPPGPGDSWPGNLVSDGDHVYFVARQAIQGFWGNLDVWRSDDGGRTWNAPVQVSRGTDPDAARHTIAIGPDGSVWVAWAERGPVALSQKLMLRVSRDHGQTWGEVAGVSYATHQTIGVPSLLLTADTRLIAFTDGITGEVVVQKLNTDGTAVLDSVNATKTLGHTDRQLYSDADFRDAAVTLASVQGKTTAVWVEGDRSLRSAASSDGGTTWTPSTGLDQQLYGGFPRFATDGATILLAATDPNAGARYNRTPFIRIWRSTDGGSTWTRGADAVQSVQIGWLGALASDGRWRMTYDACPGFGRCATAGRVWYTESADGDSWTEPVVISGTGHVGALGLAAGPAGLVAAWGDGQGSHDWAFHLAIRTP